MGHKLNIQTSINIKLYCSKTRPTLLVLTTPLLCRPFKKKKNILVTIEYVSEKKHLVLTDIMLFSELLFPLYL